MDRAAVVVGGADQVVQVEDGSFAGERRLLGVGVIDGETADLVMFAGGPGCGAGIGVGVVQVDEMVRAVIGVEGDAEQAALATGVDVQAEGGLGRAVTVDELDVAPLFEDEEPTVGRKLHRGGAAQPRNDRGFGEAGRQSRQGQAPFQPLDPRAVDGIRDSPIDCMMRA